MRNSPQTTWDCKRQTRWDSKSVCSNTRDVHVMLLTFQLIIHFFVGLFVFSFNNHSGIFTLYCSHNPSFFLSFFPYYSPFHALTHSTCHLPVPVHVTATRLLIPPTFIHSCRPYLRCKATLFPFHGCCSIHVCSPSELLQNKSIYSKAPNWQHTWSIISHRLLPFPTYGWPYLRCKATLFPFHGHCSIHVWSPLGLVKRGYG